MEFWEVLRARHSVRRYDPDADVPKEMVRQIINAALEAPSAGNCQPWHFVVVRDLSVRRRLAQAAYGQDFLAEAPVVVVVCAEPDRSTGRYGKRGKTLYCLQDTAAATEHILLAATALGFGTCWVGAFDEEAAAHVLELPTKLRPVALVPIGRPRTPSSRETARRRFNEVVSYQ
jgi:nitroreductase